MPCTNATHAFAFLAAYVLLCSIKDEGPSYALAGPIPGQIQSSLPSRKSVFGSTGSLGSPPLQRSVSSGGRGYPRARTTNNSKGVNGREMSPNRHRRNLRTRQN
nr:uncharacterized protein LOC119168105 [Rhipicephalus microplus]